MESAPNLPSLDAAWQDWIAANVLRGCTDDDMLAVMTGSGFPPDWARVALGVVRGMTERVARDQPALLTPYECDPPRWPLNGNRLRAADREVTVAMSVVDPNIAVFDGLLDAEECASLVALSAGKLERSQVVDTAGLAVSGVRTSSGTWFARGEQPLVDRLEARIAALTGIPVENGEPLQILHYRTGGEYLPHHDYFDPAQPGSAAHLVQGQRVATLVLYLSTVEAGGDTLFPKLSLSVRPRPGSAVYFEYHNAAGHLDERLLHAGQPVIAGEKWIATKWLRTGRYG